LARAFQQRQSLLAEKMEIDQLRERAFATPYVNGSARICELVGYLPAGLVMKGVMGEAGGTVTFFPYAGRW